MIHVVMISCSYGSLELAFHRRLMGAFVYIVSFNLNGYGNDIEEMLETQDMRNRKYIITGASFRLIDLGDKVLSSFELPGPKSRVANMYL